MKNTWRMAINLALISTLFLAGSLGPALAKKWTVTDRLEKLSAEVKEGRRAYELTDGQVESLNKEIAGIRSRIEKMKARNAGQLSIPDTRRVHQMLNDVSIKILRLRLENVYFEK